jgi:hypothetical protein
MGTGLGEMTRSLVSMVTATDNNAGQCSVNSEGEGEGEGTR